MLGYGQLGDVDRVTLVAITFAYMVGARLPTVAVNVPLNNRLQTHDTKSMSEAQVAAARAGFEGRWNRANVARTFAAVVSSLALIVMVSRLP